MRMAFAFRRHDVDEFLADIDADQYAEWEAFFAFEPWGWPAVQIVARRISWALFQSRRRDKTVLDEGIFGLKTNAESAPNPALQRMREEMAEANWNAQAAASGRK